MHAFDLSHPNLSAFLFKEDLISSNINWKVRLGMLLVPLGSIIPRVYLARLLKNVLDSNKELKNTLSFFEVPMEYQFLLLDYFLKHPELQSDRVMGENNTFTVGNETYNKIVLCPQSIDFGYKNLDEAGVFYNRAPFKPIAKQVGDLFYSIYTYYRFQLQPDDQNPRKLQLATIEGNTESLRHDKLFEIYPFMGLNTQNYSLNKLRGITGKTGLLDKFFSAFDGQETAQRQIVC
jgi:hypothetical protein